MEIELFKGDITKITCDCIVNSANRTLLGGSGVDGAIHKAAGPELLNECRKLGGCATGEAKITGGYNLAAKYVIHTVGPVYSEKISDGLQLMSCYINSLELAKFHDIHSIAFPSISTGIFKYPIEEAARIAIKAVHEWMQNSNYNIKVIFCCYDDITFNIYSNLLGE